MGALPRGLEARREAWAKRVEITLTGFVERGRRKCPFCSRRTATNRVQMSSSTTCLSWPALCSCCSSAPPGRNQSPRRSSNCQRQCTWRNDRVTDPCAGGERITWRHHHRTADGFAAFALLSRAPCPRRVRPGAPSRRGPALRGARAFAVWEGLFGTSARRARHTLQAHPGFCRASAELGGSHLAHRPGERARDVEGWPWRAVQASACFLRAAWCNKGWVRWAKAEGGWQRPACIIVLCERVRPYGNSWALLDTCLSQQRLSLPALARCGEACVGQQARRKACRMLRSGGGKNCVHGSTGTAGSVVSAPAAGAPGISDRRVRQRGPGSGAGPCRA